MIEVEGNISKAEAMKIFEIVSNLVDSGDQAYDFSVSGNELYYY